MKINTFLTVTLIVTAGLLKMAVSSVLYAEPLGQEIIPVVIGPGPSNPNEDPRGPVFNPFSAYLQSNQVVLSCSANCGLVSVSLVSTAGDNYLTVFDSEDGFIFIPISGDTGDYTLTLTSMTGQVFVGYFKQ